MAAYGAALASSPEAIAAALAEAPACARVVVETGRMAPVLCHGLGPRLACRLSASGARRPDLGDRGTPATHKTGRNAAPVLARLARTGAFKPVLVESLPAHAIRALIVARSKLVGRRVALGNQGRGLAVAFGVRLPRGPSPAFVEQVIAMSDGVAGLSTAQAASRRQATGACAACSMRRPMSCSPAPRAS